MLCSITFQIECAADMEKLQQLLADLTDVVAPADPTQQTAIRASAERPDKMVQPDRTPPEVPKPKGRPRKLAEAPAPDVEAPPGGADERFSDQGMLITVGTFCSVHPDKTNAISALLRTFNVERITQLEAGQRQPFLTKLEALATDGPEAA